MNFVSNLSSRSCSDEDAEKCNEVIYCLGKQNGKIETENSQAFKRGKLTESIRRRKYVQYVNIRCKNHHALPSVDESLEISMEKVTCPKCRGDGNESDTTHIQDLCPADRKKITQLISELARCTQEKHKVTADLAVSRAENEALQNQLQLLNSQHEDDKNKLRSQLSHTKAEISKLRLQISHSLNLLTEQIMALESQSTKLIETVKELINDKVSLQDALIKQKMKAQILEAKVDEVKNSKDMEKLLFMNQQIKNQTLKKCNRDCQTETKDNLHNSNICSGLKLSEMNQETHRFGKTVHIKSKHDLDDHSPEAILLRELFFKRPSLDENEGLDLFPKLPRS